MSFRFVSLSLATLYGSDGIRHIYKMKLTFSTQLPVHAPSIDQPQRRAWRNGAIRENDGTYDGTGDWDDLRYDRRYDRSGTATWNEISGDKSDADAVYHRNRKNSPPIYTKDGEGSWTISDRTAMAKAFLFSSLLPYSCTHPQLSLRRAWRQAGRCFPFPLLAWTVRGAGWRPVFRTVAPPRFPLLRLPYSAVFSVLPCLAASMSWRVRKPIAWPQSRQTSW